MAQYSFRRILSFLICCLVLISLFSVCALAEGDGDTDQLETLEMEITQAPPAFPTLWIRAVSPDNAPIPGLGLVFTLPSGTVLTLTTDGNGAASCNLPEDEYGEASIQLSAESSDYNPVEPVSVAIDTGSLASVAGQTEAGFYADVPYVITVSPRTYAIAVDSAIVNGTVTVSSSAAASGESVTVTAAPNENYTLDSLQVMQGETPVPFTVEGSVASFVMPAGDVTVSAAFREIPIPAFQTHSLVLGGELGLNFFLELPQAEGIDYAGSYMTFSVDGQTKQDALDPADTDLNGNGYYGFTCPLNALQLADEITAVFHYTQQGAERTVSEVYTAATYLNALTTNDAASEEVKTLARSLLDYGYYSQVFLSSIEDPATAANHARISQPFTAAYTADQLSGILNACSGQAFQRDRSRNIRKVTCSLYLDSTLSIYLYLDTADDYSGEISATLDGVPVPVTREEDGRLLIVIPDLTADQLDVMHQLAISTAGADPMIVRLSGLSYIRACLENEDSSDELVNAMAALYSYYSASKDLRQAS